MGARRAPASGSVVPQLRGLPGMRMSVADGCSCLQGDQMMQAAYSVCLDTRKPLSCNCSLKFQTRKFSLDLVRQNCHFLWFLFAGTESKAN